MTEVDAVKEGDDARLRELSELQKALSRFIEQTGQAL